MDKKYQDLHLYDWKNKCDVFAIRQITILTIIKQPNSFLLTYIDCGFKRREIVIPIIRHTQIVID